MIPWTERMYDMSDYEIQEYKKAFIDDYNESNKNNEREVVDMIYIEYQYYQLRRDYNWVLKQFTLSGDKNEVRREILLQRIRGSNANPISPENINYLVSNMRKASHDLLIDGKWLIKIYDHGLGVSFGVYKELDENIPYLVGIDPAGGDSIQGDNFAITIVNPRNLMVAAEFKSPYLTSTNALKLITHLIDDYIPRAVLCIERNSVGQYLIQMLADTHIKNNLYWNQKKKNELDALVEHNPLDNNALREISMVTQKYGQYLSVKVRAAMFEKLFEIVDEDISLLTTEYLVNDICSLIRFPTGKIAADNGEHDDSLMSYLHAIYVYFTGDNLPFFGIYKEQYPVFANHVEPEEDKTVETLNKAIDNSKNKKGFDIIMAGVPYAISQREAQLEELSRLSFIYDPIKVNRSESNEDDLVSINPWFFESLNR